MRIAIIGAGYVGLTSAAVYAKLGHTVFAVRKDAEKVEMLKRGEVPFYEPGLPELVKDGVQSGRLIPTTSYAEAVPNAEVIFICVGTPPLSSGEADLSQVFAAAREVAENWGEGYKVIADKSTVPVGTAQKVRKVIEEVLVARPQNRSGLATSQFDVASCPEFLREGSAVHDTLNPDRVVIGTDSERARAVLSKVHEDLPGERVITDIRTAEMIKYASNAFLATKISFINEIANVCDEVGANVDEVARGMGLDPRIGSAFLKAGIGYGGACFPKDTKALHSIAFLHDYDFKLLKAVIEVNKAQRRHFLRKVRQMLAPLAGKKIGILGLAFKNNTDDVRESAALDIASWLIKEGAQVVAYDPQAAENAKAVIKAELSPNQSSALDSVFITCPTAEEAARDADALLVLTEWKEFCDLPWSDLRSMMNQAIVFDGRNLLDSKKMRELGFTYVSVGRP
ncbi:MAG: Nucleotide sugar dehydrogenase [Parcubacteria group bacterium GW2011_GWC2_45_7]|nr:MAG: Nucleotide sugar dehydrogenase [Parcubacteria group bacterium GW2011_GWC2_45_7]KKU73001.1 MAG: Nucleotide sugar dehydrogenase [Parcubacteria group bacterium GW2011_GWA2_47_26]